MSFVVQSNSADETLELGKHLGRRLKGDEIILLSGDLGAGKTLITKGIAESLAIDPGEVVSPTFVLMNVYSGRRHLYHFDLYRLGMKGKVSDPGLDEYIGEGVIVVEWAQFLPEDYFADFPHIRVWIKILGDSSREISLESEYDYFSFTENDG